MDDRMAIQPYSQELSPLRILIADPDEAIHHTFREHLTQEGFEVASAINGLECVASLRERVPDALVIEPQMPWGGGDGVLAIMGEDPPLASVPVVVLTSCGDSDLVSRVARYPVSRYHFKPMAPDRLAITIRHLLDHPRRRFALAEQTGRLENSILKRTGGRVRNLQVEITSGGVVVRGRSDSHYVKQLVLAAVRETFEATETQSERILLNIEVD